MKLCIKPRFCFSKAFTIVLTIQIKIHLIETVEIDVNTDTEAINKFTNSLHQGNSVKFCSSQFKKPLNYCALNSERCWVKNAELILKFSLPPQTRRCSSRKPEKYKRTDSSSVKYVKQTNHSIPYVDPVFLRISMFQNKIY